MPEIVSAMLDFNFKEGECRLMKVVLWCEGRKRLFGKLVRWILIIVSVNFMLILHGSLPAILFQKLIRLAETQSMNLFPVEAGLFKVVHFCESNTPVIKGLCKFRV